ncbi:ATP-dependent Clp protease ATP-binding subunit [bacterium]|nr:ATP-dependent Clp protease ATP-binding subunit [bacterium]
MAKNITLDNEENAQNTLDNAKEKQIDKELRTLAETSRDHISNSVESQISQDTPDDKGKTSSNDKKKTEQKTLEIEYYGTDLTKDAKEGYIDPIIGREKEIDQVIYTLLRKTKNNPLLIGEPGV